MEERHSNGADYRRMTAFRLTFGLGIPPNSCTIAQAHELSGDPEILQRVEELQAQTTAKIYERLGLQPFVDALTILSVPPEEAERRWGISRELYEETHFTIFYD